MTIHEALERKAHKALMDAYLASVQRALERMNYSEAKRLIETYGIQELIARFSISPDDLLPLRDELENVFFTAGTNFQLPGRLKQLPFNRRHLAAEEAIMSEGGRLIVDISEGSREAVQNAVARGLRTGASPHKIAQDIVGTFDRAKQVRTGSIVGLAPVQEQWADRAEKELSGLDPNYFTRVLRDKRYDATVRKAIRDGKPLPTADIIRMTRRYRDRLTTYRAQTIARTEAHTVLNMGRYQKVLQNAEAAGLGPEAITAIWRAARDGRTRDTHGSLNGDRAQFGTPFRSSGGARMRYPGDRSLGAGAEEIVNCRCTLTFKVDWDA